MAQSTASTTSSEAGPSAPMTIDWDVPITMADGTVLRADVFRPEGGGPVPVILSHGCYAKGLEFQDHYGAQWHRTVTDFPEILEGSSNTYQVWEVTDPERWVPRGYAVVRVDSRGAGTSEGVQEVWGWQEIEDYAECIEWAGTQDWSDGNVGLLGISYYGANQWLVAGLQPPHLKAIIPWEGTSDWYREAFYHGGIRSTFLDSWMPRQFPMQYGYGQRGKRNPHTGEYIAGPVTLTDEELANNRVDKVAAVRSHPLNDEYWAPFAPPWDRITVPILSAANWGGQGLHLRGNVEGFVNAASSSKWLAVHGYEHWTHFYTDYGLDLQYRFFDHFLKSEENGWPQQPPVSILIRHVDPGDRGSIVGRFEQKFAAAWPLPETDWQTYYLDAGVETLNPAKPAEAAHLSYDATGSGITFQGPVYDEPTEITGPLAARLHVSSDTEDADLFLVLRVQSEDGGEVVFRGAMDAHAPASQGWLRVSHRELDPERSEPYRPFHPHTSNEPMVPGKVYEVEVEIWPTSIALPAGYRISLSIRGTDFEYDGEVDEGDNSSHRYPSRGVGPFAHNDPQTRPPETFGGNVTIHSGPEHQSSLLVPVIKR